MAIVTVLAIETDMAIVTDVHLSGTEPGIKCKEFIQSCVSGREEWVSDGMERETDGRAFFRMER